MTTAALKQMIDRGEDILLLDVREADEFKDAHDAIAGSQNMPMGKVFVEARAGLLARDKLIVTICRSGGRASIVARELTQRGYDVESLDGGLVAWKQQSDLPDA